jgi:hypothetical protein
MGDPTFDYSGMTANAVAPRNGTLEMKPPCSFANPPRQQAARVPLSRGMCLPMFSFLTAWNTSESRGTDIEHPNGELSDAY